MVAVLAWLTASPDVLWARMQGDPSTTARRPNLTAAGAINRGGYAAVPAHLTSSVAGTYNRTAINGSAFGWRERTWMKCTSMPSIVVVNCGNASSAACGTLTRNGRIAASSDPACSFAAAVTEDASAASLG